MDYVNMISALGTVNPVVAEPVAGQVGAQKRRHSICNMHHWPHPLINSEIPSSSIPSMTSFGAV